MNVSRAMRQTPANDGAFVESAGAGQIVERVEADQNGFAHIRLVDIKDKPDGWVTASAVTWAPLPLVPIDKNDFARTAWDESLYFGTNPHYLAAVAELRSRTLNTDDGAYIGVYRLRAEEWADAKWKTDEFHFHYAEADISNWRKQTSMFALMVRRITDEFVAANDKRRPNAMELYLLQMLGLAAAKKLQGGGNSTKVNAILADGDLPAGSEILAKTLKRHAAVFETAGDVATLEQAMTQLESVMQVALDGTRPFLVANGIAVLEGSASLIESSGGINFNAAVIPKQRRDIAMQIAKAFADAGFGLHHQVTALANAIGESGLDPGNTNLVGEESLGLFQFNFAPGALGTIVSHKLSIPKADFLKPEVNIRAMVYAAKETASFVKAGTLDEAMNAFVRDIENPKYPNAAVNARLGIAKALLLA